MSVTFCTSKIILRTKHLVDKPKVKVHEVKTLPLKLSVVYTGGASLLPVFGATWFTFRELSRGRDRSISQVSHFLLFFFLFLSFTFSSFFLFFYRGGVGASPSDLGWRSWDAQSKAPPPERTRGPLRPSCLLPVVTASSSAGRATAR